MDSSSIAKLYVTDELEREETRSAVNVADQVATSTIAYAEARATLARARRNRRIRSASSYRRSVQDFESEWTSFLQISVSDEIVLSAGNLTERHPLSGFDAIHLSTLMALRTRVSDEVRLSTWDRALARAAQAEGLSLAHEVNA